MGTAWWQIPFEERLAEYRALIRQGRTPIVGSLPLAGVYFYELGDDVKIGKAGNVIQRLAGFGTYHAEPGELIGFLPSGRDKSEIERAWQRRWAGERKRGEWFRLTPEFRQAIIDAQQPPELDDQGRLLVVVAEHIAEMNRLVVWCPCCGNRHFHGAMGLAQGADLAPALGSRGADCGNGTYILVLANQVPGRATA